MLKERIVHTDFFFFSDGAYFNIQNLVPRRKKENTYFSPQVCNKQLQNVLIVDTDTNYRQTENKMTSLFTGGSRMFVALPFSI